jgi:hypothetical protein
MAAIFVIGRSAHWPVNKVTGRDMQQISTRIEEKLSFLNPNFYNRKMKAPISPATTLFCLEVPLARLSHPPRRLAVAR